MALISASAQYVCVCVWYGKGKGEKGRGGIACSETPTNTLVGLLNTSMYLNFGILKIAVTESASPDECADQCMSICVCVVAITIKDLLRASAWSQPQDCS